MKNVKILILKNEKLIISEVISVMQEIGEPDCKLVKPKLVWSDVEVCSEAVKN